MTTKKYKYKTDEEIKVIGSKIMDIFTEENLEISQASGLLGAIFAYLCTKTEDNYPFVSFINSLTHTYNFNYKGDSEIEQCNKISLGSTIIEQYNKISLGSTIYDEDKEHE